MRNYFLIVFLAAAVACFMEVWAAVLHRIFWHGPLWRMHRSHHRKIGSPARFEANDALSVLHAPIAIVLIVLGCGARDMLHDVMLGVGYGMTFFGFAYLVVHDGYIHQRLPVSWLGRLHYFRQVHRAHTMHHAHREEAEDGGSRYVRDLPPYGLFLSPFLLRTVLGSELPSRGREEPSGSYPKSPAR